MTAEPDGDGVEEATRDQVRGSSLLTFGRILAIGLAFVAQVLVVRYLSRTDYGVFAYALSLVTFGESLSLLGFDRGVARFIPIYDESGDRAKILGLISMVVGTIVGVGTAYVLITAALSSSLAAPLNAGPEAPTVLLLLAILGPLQAFDRLGTSLLAIFSKPTAIFWRKYVLGPGLRVLAVLAVIGVDGGVVAMSWAYLAAGVIGVLIYLWVLVIAIRAGGNLRGTSLRTARLPWREVLAFSLPLLSTDLVFTTIGSIDGIMVGFFAGAEEVAGIRAVQPIARLNQLVLSGFGVLFTPMAARLFAREDHDGIGSLYWTTATWVALLTFPVFALTFVLSDQIAVWAFGAEYADAGLLLAIYAVGNFTTAALGFNGMVLNVYGRVREVVILNLTAAAANIVMNLVLIPSAGARGAALASAGTFVVHNLLKQRELGRSTHLSALARDRVGVYVSLSVGTLALIVIRLLPLGWPLQAVAAVVVTVVLLALNRRALSIGETFPAVRKIPVLGKHL